MARGGSKPGERRGGRKKGVPNKTNLRRENEIVIARRASGTMLAKDVMHVVMMEFIKLAQEFAPEILEEVVDPDEKKSGRARYEHLMARASAIAKDLAPYESPRLNNTSFVGANPGEPAVIQIKVEYV